MDSKDIAVIGMSCRLPGASNYNEFWQNLIQQRRFTGEVPSDRDFKTIYKKHELKGVSMDVLRWGGFVEDIHRFDQAVFNIPKNETLQMDPMQKILMEATYACIEDAGYSPKKMKGSSIGVFLGASTHDFKEIKENNKSKNNAYTSFGSSSCFLSARLSYEFGFKGPSLTLDTACSSSSVAIHYAIQSLINNECSSALCGGANYIGTPTRHIEGSRLGLLSKKGTCASFDESADGFVRSEGVGLILLKKLSNAIENNDHIYGVIKATGVNHSGHGKNLVVPNIFAQSQLMSNTLERAEVEPQTVKYIEAQAIGNFDVDALEFIALKRTFDTTKRNEKIEKPCLVGTYKPITGHPEPVSGTIAIIKSMLSFKYETLPAIAGLKNLNPKIEKNSNYLKVIRETTEFKRDQLPRRIAINNFGVSNTNCCLVLEEFTPTSKGKSDSKKSNKILPFLFSAESKKSLNEQCQEIKALLEVDKLSLKDVAGTLMSGRDHHKYRLGIVAKSVSELISGMESFLNEIPNELIKVGEVPDKENTNIVDASIPKRQTKKDQYLQLIEKWINGNTFEENQVFKPNEWSKIPLPGYAFQGEAIVYHEPNPKEQEDTTLISSQSKNLVNSKLSIQGYTSFYKEVKISKTKSELKNLYVLSNFSVDDNLFYTELKKTENCTLITNGNDFQIKTSGNIGFDFYNEEHYQKLLTTLSEHSYLNFIFYLKSASKDTGIILKDIYFPIFQLAKNLSKFKKTKSTILIPYFNEDNATIYFDALDGFARSLQKETPTVKIQPIRLKTQLDNEKSIQSLLSVFDEVSLRTGYVMEDEKHLERKLQKVYIPKVSENNWLKNQGVYVIAGGFAEIGKLLVEYILDHVNASIVLIGRSPLMDEREELINSWQKKYDQKIEYFSIDISMASSVKMLAAYLTSEYREINGVFNVAGITDDKLISNKNWRSFEKVIEPKVNGTNNLWDMLSSITTDFFCLFSSVSSILGNLGQVDYSLANAYQNAFSKINNSNAKNKLQVTSICWPYWANGGMNIKEDTLSYMKKKLGFNPLQNDKAFSLLNAAISANLDEVIFFEGDQNTIQLHLQKEGIYESDTEDLELKVSNTINIDNIVEVIKNIFSDLTDIEVRDIKGDEYIVNYGIDSMVMMALMNEIESEFDINVDGSLFTETTSINSLSLQISEENAIPPDHLKQNGLQTEIIGSQAIAEVIKNIFSGLADVETKDIDLDEYIVNYGVDSMVMMAMMNEIESEFDISVDASMFTETTSVNSLARQISEENSITIEHVEQNESQDCVEKTAPKTEQSSGTEMNFNQPIAVIGMAGRFPKSDSVDELWEHLCNGRELTGQIPEERKIINDYCVSSIRGEKFASFRGGFVNNVGSFDPAFFNIKDDEAISMDFNQRVILEEAQHLLDQAAYDPSEIRGKKIGVFLAGERTPAARENIDLFSNKEMKQALLGQISNMIAARISHQFDLKGPSVLIHTACSGALVAVHQACNSIRSGDCEMSIAGGVFVSLNSNIQAGFHDAGVISPTGSMKVFDQNADGIILGEAASLVLLKKYDDAVRDGDNILGVIRGSSVNNDGLTMGVTTPNLKAQKEVVRSVLEKSNINPKDISYVEAHGTGTLLGDPIEIKALTQVFGEFTKSKQYCAVGSVKSNTGHAMSAAASTGLVKILKMLQHKKIPPTINCEHPHSRFRFDNSPFYPNTELIDWKSNNKTRIAAISSFGFGGTNGHLIIEEFLPPKKYIKKRHPKSLSSFKRKQMIPGTFTVEEKIETILKDLEKELITIEEAKEKVHAYIQD